MRKFITLSAALLAVALMGVSVASAEDEAVYEKLMKAKAGSVVSIKLVLAVKISSPRGSQDQEINTRATGILVDSVGLIMLPDAAFDAGRMMGIPRRFRSQMSVTSSPISIRVTFPGDTKEYDAVLGAKDSKLGLGFVLIKDLAGKTVECVDFASTVEPKLGQSLYGVTRLDQGFDFAPMCTEVKIAGQVTKPRAMWIVQGGGGYLAQPLFDASGAVAGIVVDQEGVGEDSQSRPFLLPTKVATATISGALKKSKDELERILDEEAEAAEGADDEADEDDKKEGEGEKKKDADDKKDGDGE